MKILITGAGGYIGKNLCDSLKNDHSVFGFGLDKKKVFSDNHRFTEGDVTDFSAVFGIVSKIRPDLIIHVAAINSLKKCEEDYEGCFRINVGGLENIIKAVKSSKNPETKLVFLSSDYVFDGKKGNYSEKDRVNPITAYGKMKVLCEELIKKNLKNYLIIRTANVYLKGGNFFTFLKNNLENGISAEYFDDAYYTPTNINLLISGLKLALDRNITGLLHIAGSERVSRYDFASTFVDVLMRDKNKLIVPAKTPKEMLLGKDLSLATSEFRKLAKDILLPTIYESLYLEHGLFLKSHFSFLDNRGSIANVLQAGHWEEANYITSKGGFIRGNHYHKETKEVIHIIKGKIKVTLNRVDGAFLKEFTIKKGDTVVMLPYIVHKFEILKDSSWINMLSKAMVGDKKDIISVQ